MFKGNFLEILTIEFFKFLSKILAPWLPPTINIFILSLLLED